MHSSRYRPFPFTAPTLLGAALLGAAALLSGCASPERAGDDDAAPGGDAALTAAEEEEAPNDVGAALWGDAAPEDGAALIAFLSEPPTGEGGGDLTRTVSLTSGNPAHVGHVVSALRLRDGKLLAGRVLGDDGNVVEFAFETPDGVRGTTRVRYTDIHPESIAELMLARADEQDAGALMEIAEYAANEGLYEIARVHYLAAAEQDEAVAGIAQRRLLDLAQQASDTELERGRDAAASGNDQVARRILRRVQREFAGTQAAADAEAAIAEIDARRDAQKLDAARERRIAPLRDLLAEAETLTGRGLQNAHKPSIAIRSYMAARSKTAAARRRLPAAEKAGETAGDEELLGALGDVGARLDEQDVDNETQLAAAYLDKGDLSRAKQAASSVIAIDRTNREALALLGQIRAAEEERRGATYDVWWYRYRRQRGVYPYPHRWYPGRGRGWGTIRRGGATRTTTRAPIGVFRR